MLDDHSPWLFPKSVAEAQTAQQEMAKKIILENRLPPSISYIAGVDVSTTPFDPEQKLFGAIVILSYPALEVVETAAHAAKQTFPYVPGLLGFREIPVLIQAYQKLTIQPDLVLVDGHGISHPRGLGIASHLGLLLDLPTIGVAKSILVGKPEKPLSEIPGSSVALQWKGRTLGMLVRTKKKCNPLIISSGHKISLESAMRWTLQCLRGYRLPEPTRRAHKASNACRKKQIID